MAHSLIRIKGSLVNTPHLIEQQSFNSIMDYVNSRVEGNADILAPQPEAFLDDPSHRYVADTQTGVMHISGPLTYRTSGWEAMCGGTSYEMLKEQMEYFVEAGAKTVVMMVDSGGGEAKSMIDSANYIRKLADENDVKIIAYVDGMSASAAYGISCVADEIVMAADSQVGSIGVLIQLMNNSKALEKAGYERTFITAGKDKVPFAKDGSFTDAFLNGLQEQVDTLYESFTSHVAEHRGMSLDAVKGTEANVFMADEAIKLGLADKVMTIEEFYDYSASVAQENIEGDMNIKQALKFGKQEDKAEMAKLAEMTAQLEAEGAARATAEAALAAMTTQMSEATAALATMKAELDGFKQAQAEAAEAAAAALVAKREAALAEVVPAAEVESYMTNMASLDEGAFAFMVASLKATKDARAVEMQEVGEDGAQEEDTDAPVDRLEAIRAAGIAAAKAVAR
jgi:signal peptide peptidase SppA